MPLDPTALPGRSHVPPALRGISAQKGYHPCVLLEISLFMGVVPVNLVTMERSAQIHHSYPRYALLCIYVQFSKSSIQNSTQVHALRNWLKALNHLQLMPLSLVLALSPEVDKLKRYICMLTAVGSENQGTFQVLALCQNT